MTNLRRWIAERLFSRELDEDYYMGARYGQEKANTAARSKVEMAGVVTAKRNKPGLAVALKALT